ncbi:mechanosensitive ion channel [Vibrio cholerae]|nr:mechanosensitive ion channel [Vibrio cholerae]
MLRPADTQRHYYGHGVYSHDGRYLYATEGGQKTSRGVIGVYDVTHHYQKVAEWSGFGIGPHEVILMADGRLVVGVGGVHTFGREPLNLESMQPSLTYLSAQGEVLEQITLPDRHLSIRHLAHDGDNTVLCGQQYRGQPDDYPPLVAMHTGTGPLKPLQAEPEQWARFNHYIASIAATDEWILATSPPGNCYGIWSKATGELVELAALADASGVVVRHGAFQISSGSGKIILQSAPELSQSHMSNVMWDNHWSAI